MSYGFVENADKSAHPERQLLATSGKLLSLPYLDGFKPRHQYLANSQILIKEWSFFGPRESWQRNCW